MKSALRQNKYCTDICVSLLHLLQLDNVIFSQFNLIKKNQVGETYYTDLFSADFLVLMLSYRHFHSMSPFL